jgi:hypothetical protein
VWREQLRPDGERRLDTARLGVDDLEADEAGEPALTDAAERLAVYFPATDETYLATAVICLSVSVPLKAGMIPPPTST